ncbi:hypothetical protein MLD38_006339 [Melastoma candidum]|uniref:Uncharacterized protein n=1 Tax=Melastoma candidum TaxID=119954 RepID=A0ACB9RML5_9MYRT|nr:hypothetical protein MLD38_006339 [Melastoma candidum]
MTKAPLGNRNARGRRKPLMTTKRRESLTSPPSLPSLPTYDHPTFPLINCNHPANRSILIPPPPIPDHLPLHSYCFENLSEFHHRPCLIDGPSGKVYSYEDVEIASRCVASGLHRLGIGHGDVIMILLQNSPEFVFAFLGASYRGAISATANPFHMPAEIAKHAAASQVVITQASYIDKLKGIDGIRIVTIDNHVAGMMHFSELAEADEEEMQAVEITPDDVVALPYSSGTTGLPKGVMLTHRGLVTSVAQQAQGGRFHPDHAEVRDPHPAGIRPKVQGHNCALRAAHHAGIAKSTDMDKYDLSSIRMVMSGAAPLGKEVEDAVRAKLPNAKLGQGYGMTEAGPVLAMCLAFAKEPFEIKSGACGTVVRNAEMKIVDPETGRSLQRNHSGEICIRGKQIMKGYLNDPAATARTIDKEGWLHTGDIGYIDDDDELFIVDRLKELIKYKGFQVAPAELEALLVAHPNIHDAAVVPMKDEAAGEVPVAFVVHSKGSQISEDEIKQYISKQVVFYKSINKVFFADSIPRAPSGKILRKDLRSKLAAA